MKPDLAKLADFFPPEDVEWKPGSTTKDKKKGLAMAYITNRAIMQRLDDVCGPAGWRNEFKEGPGGGVLCGLSINVTGDDADPRWVTKWDGAENTHVEAVKGGLSDSMKRAGYQWGIGRYLYQLPSVWVPLDDRGRFTQTPQIPTEFLPEGHRRPMPSARRPNTANVPPPASAAPDRPALTPAQKRAHEALTRAGLDRQAAVDILGRYGAERISELTDADAEALAASLSA